MVAGNCGYSIAPCRKEDHAYMTALFAKVEGMTPSVLEQGLPWDWDSFPSYLDALDKRLGINMACYVGHSALRRFVMGDAASERAANADELHRMQQLVREAMHAGAAGFSSSLAPTHVDQFNQPVPSRHAQFDEIATLVETTGEGGAGSISFLPETAVRGLDERDRSRLIELAKRSGLPIIVQGITKRVGNPDQWADSVAFLESARQQGAAIFSVLRTQPFMRPFNWQRGTSLYDGIFHWRDLSEMPPAQRLAKMRDPQFREQLRWGLDNPNTAAARDPRCRRLRCTRFSSTSAGPIRVRWGRAWRSSPRSGTCTRPTSCASWRPATISQRSSSGTPRARCGRRPTATHSAIRT